MKPMTLKELADLATKAVNEGWGDRIICVSDDEELNGFHPIFDKHFYTGEEITYLNEETHKMETKRTLTLG